jgi:hypothetical protein
VADRCAEGGALGCRGILLGLRRVPLKAQEGQHERRIVARLTGAVATWSADRVHPTVRTRAC